MSCGLLALARRLFLLELLFLLLNMPKVGHEPVEVANRDEWARVAKICYLAYLVCFKKAFQTREICRFKRERLESFEMIYHCPMLKGKKKGGFV